MSIRTTQEDHGDTVPGGLGPVVGRTGNDVWREELAKKVAARNKSGGTPGIVVGKDGRLSTDLPDPREQNWPFMGGKP